MTRGRPGVSKGSSCTLKWNAWREGEAAKVGETVTAISFEVTEGRGSLACWAMADRERVRIGLWRKGVARGLERAIVEGDNQLRKRGGPWGAARDRDARALTKDLAPTCG